MAIDEELVDLLDEPVDQPSVTWRSPATWISVVASSTSSTICSECWETFRWT
jgi:hypothetical protein